MSVVANVAINVDSRDATQKLREVRVGAKATEQAFNALNQVAAAFGAGFALSKVIADVKELDTNLRRLGTVGGDVTALDKGLGQLSKNLDGVASKAELAAASYQALSAGFTETGANLKLVEAATKVAVGGLADTTQVAEVLTKTLNAYGLSGNQAIKVTDSISKAVEYGQVEWADYTSQLGRVASIAAIAGVSIDEVNAFIAAATKNGATAEIAFTGLSATLNTLLQPTEESQKAAAALGIQWNIAGLNAKGFDGLITELAQKMGTNKEAATRLLGSQEAMRGAFAAASKGGKDFSAALTAIQDATGKTDSDFQKMKKSLANQLKTLDTAFKNLSEALGKAFGSTVVDVVGDLTGAINGFADAINAVPQPVAAAAVEILKLLAQIVLLQKAIQGIIALRAVFVAAMTGMAATTAATGVAATTSSSAFALYTANTRTLQAAASSATPALAGLRGILASLASIGTIAIVLNVAVYGLQELQRTQEILDRLRGNKPGGIPKSGIFPGETRAGLLKRQEQQRAQIPQLLEKIRKQEAIAAGSPAGMGFFARRELDILKGRLTEAQRTVGADANTIPIRKPNGRPTSPPPPDPAGGGGGGRTGASEAEQAAKRLAEEIKRSFEEGKNLTREFERQKALLNATTDFDRQRLQIQFEYQDNVRKIAELKNAEQAIAATILNREIRKLQILKLQREEQEAIRDLLESTFKDMPAAGTGKEDSFRAIFDQRIPDAIQQSKDRLKELTDPVNQIIGAATAIGDAFAESFRGVVSGSMTAQQALASFFQSVADHFIDMAARIAAEAIVLQGIKLLSSLLGPLLSGGFSVAGPGMDLPGLSGAGALGGAPITPGGVFAEGGFVTGPTNALIGEGGQPEYVIPASKMRSAMGRYAAGARGSSVIPSSAGGDGGPNQPGGAAASSIDVRYTVERINSVDYVTADQFQAGMQQAATQGAQRGEQRALRTLQQSTSIRSKVGMR